MQRFPPAAFGAGLPLRGGALSTGRHRGRRPRTCGVPFVPDGSPGIHPMEKGRARGRGLEVPPIERRYLGGSAGAVSGAGAAAGAPGSAVTTGVGAAAGRLSGLNFGTGTVKTWSWPKTVSFPEKTTSR